VTSITDPEANARADKLDEALVDQKRIYDSAAIETLIATFTDRDRIELLVEHGGGLVPASLRHDRWHVQGSLHKGVALCLDIEVPALRGSGDPDPVAYALTFEDVESTFDPGPIVAWAGDQFYADLDAFKAGKALPTRLAIELLAREPLHGIE